MKILIVGGTFDDSGGYPSSLVKRFCNAIRGISGDNHEITYINGGYYDDLNKHLDSVVGYDCVVWWANVPNDKPKLRHVKKINPRTILVTSKRNDDGKYGFQELINHALGIKANLTIEFSRGEDNKFKMMLFDPLGNSWYEGYDIDICGEHTLRSVEYLAGITRQGTIHLMPNNGDIPEVPDNPEFFSLIKEYAEVLHELIMPADGVTRFLGNTSFRCMRGFPSFKKSGIIYVSRRNVDKRYIDKDAFVPTILALGDVFYYGDHKPSVDTPVQLRLYSMLPKINYMFHSHVYIKDAPFTSVMVPCGGIEEVAEVITAIEKHYESLHLPFYAINLIGHGSIVMSSDVDKLKNIEFVRRELPERFAVRV